MTTTIWTRQRQAKQLRSTLREFLPGGGVRLAHVPLIYTFDLAGYRPSALPAGQRGRYKLGGFIDATFNVMKVLEDGRNAGWPFMA